MADRFQFRRGTAARWLAVNPILAEGEPALELDTQKFKVGDGTTNYKDLPYMDKKLWEAIDGLKNASGSVYTYRGSIVPIIPDTRYSAYYITMYNMSKADNQITVPKPTESLKDGTIFVVDNNDTNNTLFIAPAQGETINGKTSIYKMTPDSVVFLVKNGTDWNIAYSGYMPRNLSTLLDKIKDKLSDQLHTIEEIKQQVGALGVTVVGDDAAYVSNDLTRLEFPKAVTAVDPNNPTTVQVETYTDIKFPLSQLPGAPKTPSIKANSISFLPPLQGFSDPDLPLGVMVELQKGLYEAKHAEGILAFLGRDLQVNSLHGKSRLYFSGRGVKGGQFVYQDLTTKSFILQDVDPQDDPNISGGTTFIVAAYIEPDPSEDNIFTQDGYVEVEICDDKDQILTDSAGNPMGVRIHYSAQEKMKPELFIGEYQAKGAVKVHARITPIFPSEEIISLGSGSCVLFQSTTQHESCGTALLAFMAFTGNRLKFDSLYFGNKSLSLQPFLEFDEPEETLVKSHMNFGDNTYMDVQNCKVSISNKTLVIKDAGVKPVFSITKYYDATETFFMHGKTYNVTVGAVDKDVAFTVSMLTFVGAGVAPKPTLIEYNNGTPVFTPGWVSEEDMYISDNYDKTFLQSQPFVIPDNAKAVAFILYATTSEQPLELKLNQFQGDITPWFTKNLISSSFNISEEVLTYKDSHYQFSTGLVKGASGFRYTGNAADTPVPWGIPHVNNQADIVNTGDWHSGGNTWAAEGDGEFKVEGKATIQWETTRAYCGESVPVGGKSQNEIWLAKMEEDGTFSKVPDSSVKFELSKDKTTPSTIRSSKFTINIGAKDRYRILMKSNIDDGMFLQCGTDGVPLFKISIDYDILSGRLELLSTINDKVVITPQAQRDGWYIELDEVGGKPSISPKRR